MFGGRIWRDMREGFAEALAGPGTRRIDLAGRLAVRAFNDRHQHLPPMG